MNVKKIIPVVFATNDKYVPYLGVALFSLIQCASQKFEYQIYILSTDISIRHVDRLKYLEKDNIHICFCDVSKMMEGKNIGTVNHLSPETTYRLLISELFSEYKKVLYLDCDIIVKQDVAELFKIELGENIIGAVRGRLFPFSVKYIEEELYLNIRNYFNAGILVINIEQFTRFEIGKKGLQMLSERNYVTQDQDVLNLLCANRVLFIDGRWNVEWEHLTGFSGEPVIDEAREGTLEYIKDPYIVHYTSPVKPWAHPEIQLAEYFWSCARETPFYEEILYQNLVSEELWSHYLFPWKSVKPHSKVILYGYGKVGHIFYEQIRKTNYCKLLAICDKYAKDPSKVHVPLIRISEIEQLNYDYIVIAIEQDKIVSEIKSELLKAGISSNKIVWENPIR